MVALLRAVNVGGRKLPMAELRALCATLGWTDVNGQSHTLNLDTRMQAAQTKAGDGDETDYKR